MKKFLGLLLVATLLFAGCSQESGHRRSGGPGHRAGRRRTGTPCRGRNRRTCRRAGGARAGRRGAEAVAEPAATKVFFAFDSSLLTPESKAVLTANSLWLQAQPEVRIVIEGNTDERGSSSYNLALGEKRAQAARDYLVNLGVAPDRIAFISYGEEKAARAANDEAIWAKDRRAVIVRKD